jgi:hypothetical protein
MAHLILNLGTAFPVVKVVFQRGLKHLTGQLALITHTLENLQLDHLVLCFAHRAKSPPALGLSFPIYNEGIRLGPYGSFRH